jgi:putative colanic acid biosynthesis UDP-glucose lipid carrier transferase
VKPVNTFKVSSNNYSFVYRFLDLSCVTCSLVFVVTSFDIPMTQDHIVVALTAAVVFLYFAEALDLYQSWRSGRFTRVLITVCGVFLYSFIILLVIGIWLQQLFIFPTKVMLTWFAFTFVFCFLWRVLKHQWTITRNKLGINLQKMAIMGATDTGANLYSEIMKNDELGFDFIGFFDDREAGRLYEDLDVVSDISHGIECAKNGQIDVLFIALPISAEKRIAEIINLLADTTVDVYVIPIFMLSDVMHGRVTHIGKIDTLSIFESPYLGTRIWLKRLEDIVVSLAAIFILLPFFIMIPIILKLTSKGPVLFRQTRYGLHGQEISILKFRSMSVMESDGVIIQATKQDRRVTPFGRFLRQTSLDEIPQFFNVLRGDMSVVGPRPHAVSHNEEYRRLVQFYMLRHHVKPGITGWAQVSGWRGETDTLEKMEKRIEFDLQYIMKWSIWFDLKILILTLLKGFNSNNAY